MFLIGMESRVEQLGPVHQSSQASRRAVNFSSGRTSCRPAAAAGTVPGPQTEELAQMCWAPARYLSRTRLSTRLAETRLDNSDVRPTRSSAAEQLQDSGFRDGLPAVESCLRAIRI